ncbi:MAG TPA: DsbA family protein, partial [Gallionellaceae bacterium]|nr:DsbA family protein [Gallionellaceae bacterium]
VERLFAAHFQQGKFIGDKQLLIKLAVECGDDAAAVAAYLDTLEGSVAVLEQAVRARKAGITGVPFFIFNGKQAMTGAQPPEQMLGIIEQVLRG